MVTIYHGNQFKEHRGINKSKLPITLHPLRKPNLRPYKNICFVEECWIMRNLN